MEIIKHTKCPQKNDAFTKTDTVKENGNLVYPVGIITAEYVKSLNNITGIGTMEAKSSELQTVIYDPPN